VLLTDSFELQTKILRRSSIAQGARASFVHVYESAELFTLQNVEKNNVRVRGIQWEFRLKDDE